MNLIIGTDRRKDPQVQFACKNVGDAPPPGVKYDVEWWTVNTINRQRDRIDAATREMVELPAILPDIQLPKGLNVDVSQILILLIFTITHQKYLAFEANV